MTTQFGCCTFASIDIRFVFGVPFLELIHGESSVCVNRTIVMSSDSSSINNRACCASSWKGTIIPSTNLALKIPPFDLEINPDLSI